MENNKAEKIKGVWKYEMFQSFPNLKMRAIVAAGYLSEKRNHAALKFCGLCCLEHFF